MNASGTFDAIAARRAFGDALLERLPVRRVRLQDGDAVAAPGQSPPRLWELGAGMINSIGLPNKGLDGYLAHDLPELARLPVPLIVNVMGSSAEDVAALVRAFGERDEVAALELNVSCPNVKTGLMMGADPARRGAARCGPPVHSEAGDREADAELHVAGGRRGRRGGARGRRGLADQHCPRDGHGPAAAGQAVARWRDGGVSGPAVRAVALAQVREVRARVAIPSSGWAACSRVVTLETLDAGADLVGMGTESFRDPLAGAGSPKSSQRAAILPPQRNPRARA